MVDCVFKAILGAPENINLTLNFLNAIIKPGIPIKQIEIQNPYNEKEFLSDKLTIVDIKAKDEQNNSYQIEVQLAVFSYLPERMLYTWSDIYQSQLTSGKNFKELKPVVSIWLLGDTLLNQSAEFHHHFQIYDSVKKVPLSDHCSIHLIELPKWQQKSDTLNNEDEWLYFFQNAKNWDQLPNQLNTPEMRQAMEVLSMFSEKENEYHRYQSRRIALIEEATKKQLFEEAEQKLIKVAKIEQENKQVKENLKQVKEENKQALKEKEQAQKERKQALEEKERLIILLKNAGIDPNSST